MSAGNDEPVGDPQNAADRFPLALRALGEDHAHATTVLAELERLIRLTPAGHDEAIADDVVQDVLLKLLDRDTVKRIKPGGERAYVTAMLRNRARDVLRKERLRSTTRSEMIPVAEPVHERVSAIHRAELERALRTVVDDAVTTRREAWRDGLRKDIDQVIALATGEATMKTLIAQEPDASSSATTRANRLFKRHQRAREALTRSAERLSTGGELSSDELAVVHQVLKLLLRCQPPSASNVDQET